MIRRPPRSTLFPYTRSSDLEQGADDAVHRCQRVAERDAGTHRRSILVPRDVAQTDRKSTRLNSSHSQISYAVFCLKKKKKKKKNKTQKTKQEKSTKQKRSNT